MRRSAFVFLFFLSLAFPSLAAAQHAIASASAESDVAAVMQGLSFPVEIADRESAGEPIGERLDFHRVPGVAVAVVREVELRWARGFGVKRESGFHQPLPDSLAGAVSTGHGGDGQPIPGRWWTLPEMAAGGLWSTAPDLARLAIGLVSAWREEEGALLAPQLAREMMRDQIDGFGLGLMVDRPGGELRLTHTGSNDGYRAIVVVYPERGDAIAVMTNGDRGDALRDEIVRAAAREHGWPGYEPTVRRVAEVDQETLSSLVGTYDYGGGYRTVITLEEGRLWARLGDGPAWELFPETESRFFSLGGATYTFVRDSAGTVTGVEADVGAGRPFEGRKT